MISSQRIRTLGAALSLAVLVTASAVSSAASDPAATPADSPAPSAASNAAAMIKKTIEMRFPGTKVQDVQPSPMAGIYEVYVDGKFIYTDASANFILTGSMIDTQTRQDLTEGRTADRGAIDFRTLPLDRAIKVVKGNGSRAFAVFSDPDCPYCLQLEKSLVAVSDVTMYVFLYPIASLHPQATSKAHAIWCAKDRAQAWTEWMQARKLPPAGFCKADPVDELQKLGQKLNIYGTPTLFFANGRRVSGALSTAQLEQDLTLATGPKAAAAVR